MRVRKEGLQIVDDEYVHYLDCDNGFTCVYMYVKTLNDTI